MARKAAQHCEIRPWLSAKANCQEGRFIQVGDSLLFSEAFHDLNDGAKYLYFCMAMESGGRKDFLFPLSAAEKKYGIKERSLYRHVEELCKAGFIKKQSGSNLRKPSEYSFVFGWKS